MGSQRSTRWCNHERSPLVEDARCLDLLSPRWREVLRLERADGRLEWRRRGGVAPDRWADFHMNPSHTDGSRLLVLDFSGDPTEPKERLLLEEVRVGFDQRWHARCPVCDRSVQKLYLAEPPDTLADRIFDLRSKPTIPVVADRPIVCRHCAGLAYLSDQTRDKRVALCRRDPAEFIRSRSRLTSFRSQLVTAAVYIEAQRQGFRPPAT